VHLHSQSILVVEEYDTFDTLANHLLATFSLLSSNINAPQSRRTLMLLFTRDLMMNSDIVLVDDILPDGGNAK
jgi:hypothetical protein